MFAAYKGRCPTCGTDHSLSEDDLPHMPEGSLQEGDIHPSKPGNEARGETPANLPGDRRGDNAEAGGRGSDPDTKQSSEARHMSAEMQDATTKLRDSLAGVEGVK